MFKKYPLLTLGFLCLALSFLYQADSAVIGLDLGSEYMKISSISPGKSFYIVEDTTTKRKTPTAIGFHNNERIFEYDTLVKRPRAFQTMFMNLPKFLGKDFDNKKLQEQVKYYLEDYNMVQNDRGTVSFRLKNFKITGEDDENYELKIEELLGMIFRHIKDLASKQAERVLKDIVVTVPPFWNFRERYALHDALVMADLNPLAFVSENTAAALYYALERQDNQTHTIILYNLGSTALKVSVVEFYLTTSTDKADKGAAIESLRVLSEAWDENLGGLHIDLNVLKHFASEFDTKPTRKGQKSLLTSNPAKAKLMKEVTRLKEILSANKQASLHMENLFESTDLKSTLQRGVFETINQDLFDRLTRPIDEALQKAGKTMADIDSFELLGGGVRVPRIHQVLSEYLKGKEVSTHLNGDESMALGAAFHAANLSASFKTRQIYMNDGYNFDIRVELRDIEAAEGGEEGLNKQAVLFPAKTRFGSKKILAFDHSQDLKATFFATVTGETEESKVIEFEVTGLKEALQSSKFEGKDIGTPKVNLHFRLNPLGFIELSKAEATVEEIILYEDTKGKSNTTKTTTETDADADATTADNAEAGETKDTTGDADADAGESTTEDSGKIFKKKKHTHFITLKVDQKVLQGPGSMTEEELEKSRDLLSKFDHYEEQKKKTAEAKNRLEAFIYSTRDFLDEEDFVVSGKEEEIEQLKKHLEENRDWLESSEAYSANHSPFQKRWEDMNKIVSKLQHRLEQRLKRPEAVEKAREHLKNFINKVKDVPSTKSWVTSDVVDDAVKKIEDIGEWLSETLEKQNLLKHHDDPVLTTEGIVKKLEKAREIFNKIKNTQKPKAGKNETDTAGSGDFYNFGGKNFDGKFDEEKLREYMKKMNITFDGDKFKKEGEDVNIDDVATDANKEGGDDTQAGDDTNAEANTADAGDEDRKEEEPVKQDKKKGFGDEL
jgi:hypoxia up-regulated 1